MKKNLLPSEISADASVSGKPVVGWLWVVLLAVLLILVVGIFGLIFWPKAKEKVVVIPPVAVPVMVQEVIRTNIEEQVVLTGKVEAEKNLNLAVDDNGRILWMGADQGDRVREGQLLLRLDDAVATAAVARAEVSLRQAEEDLSRWLAMKDAGAVSVHDYEAVRNHRDLARIAYEEAGGILAKRRVYSPVDGVVNRRFVEVGEMAMPGKPAFQVVQMDRVKVIVDIPERDVSFMRVGMPLPFTVDALGGGGCTGHVVFVASAADESSLTYRLEIGADNLEGRLKPGMIARVRLGRGKQADAVVVPLRALIPDQGQYVAYVVENERSVRRVVKLNAVVDTVAVVAEGLHSGDQVITAGQRLISDGANVRVLP